MPELDDLDAVKAQHDERHALNGVTYCGDGCGDWPCLTRRLADRAQEAERRLDDTCGCV